MNRLTSLWHHTDCLKLWIAQTLAALSANVTTLAVPLIAALTLHASPFEMGLLSTVATLPNIVIGLFVGLWVDRDRRRSLMIAADIGRALVLVSVPIAAIVDLLTIWQLYAVLFVCGVWATVFDVAHVSYVPSLVKREALVSATSQLVASTAVAGAVGPGLAGGLIQLLTAPVAILVNACALGLSAMLVLVIRSHEPDPTPPTHHSSVWSEEARNRRTAKDRRATAVEFRNRAYSHVCCACRRQLITFASVESVPETSSTSSAVPAC